MAQSSLVQLHTTINSNLMSKFKHLCQSTKYPISVGTAIKRLMTESIKKQKLPGEKINNDKALQELIYHYSLDDVNISSLSAHLNSAIIHHRGIKAQKRTIKDVALVAKEVIPKPQGIPMYGIAMTRDYFQIILLDYMMSEQVLIQYMNLHINHRSNEAIFLSKLSILADMISSFKFQSVTNDKQTWFDASGVLVKKLPILGQRWRYLMYEITSSSKYRNEWKIVLNWYLHQYIHRHVKNLTKFLENKTTFKPSPNMGIDLTSIIQQLQKIAHKVTTP